MMVSEVLPNCMKSHIDEGNEDSMLADMRREVVELCGLYGDAEGDSSVVGERMVAVRRALAQFDSGMEVIICIGMLKAGKSTLVNLLTRSGNASPMGYGQDTTLRPVIIRMAAPGQDPGVIIYEESALAGGDRSACVRRVMDDLRGIAHGEEDEIRVRVLPLNEEVLTRVLCSEPGTFRELPVEPVMVVVETPYREDCELLRDRQRMLLDMPGCDSPHARVAQSGLYRELGKECDLVLVLQSTVAPLNEKAVELFREILGERSSSTVRLIQNRMEAKPWLRHSEIVARNQDQMANARRVFARIAGGGRADISSVNLGMAYAGVFESPERLNLPVQMAGGTYPTREAMLQASGFPEVERELSAALPGIRFAHCMDELRNALLCLQRTIGEECADLAGQINELQAVREQWRTFGYSSTELLVPAQLPQNVTLAIGSREDMPDFHRLVLRTCHSWKNGRLSREEVPGEEVNKCLAACNRACRDELREYLREGIELHRLCAVMADGDSVPLDRYCDDVLLRGGLREGIAKLDSRFPSLFRSFSATERPEYIGSVRNERLHLPVPSVEELELFTFECMIETTKEPGRLWGTNTVTETYRNVLRHEPFLSRLEQMADYYADYLNRLLRKYDPSGILASLVQQAAVCATANFHRAIRDRLRANRAELDWLGGRLERLQHLGNNVGEMIRKHEDNH